MVAVACGSGAAERGVLVGVAANFTEPAREIAAAFERETGHRVRLSFGSTGQLYAQISEGAPFEVFLAADAERPARAEQAGHAVAGSRFTYATGRLALFSREEGIEMGPESVRDPGAGRIALANPETAPYGRAAWEAVVALGAVESVSGRRVIGTNVAQAFQFVHTGNADLGFVSLSQITLHPGGSRWIVPEALHAPIRQQAVLLEAGRSRPGAARFLDFLRGEAARNLLRRFGYGVR